MTRWRCHTRISPTQLLVASATWQRRFSTAPWHQDVFDHLTTRPDPRPALLCSVRCTSECSCTKNQRLSSISHTCIHYVLAPCNLRVVMAHSSVYFPYTVLASSFPKVVSAAKSGCSVMRLCLLMPCCLSLSSKASAEGTQFRSRVRHGSTRFCGVSLLRRLAKRERGSRGLRGHRWMGCWQVWCRSRRRVDPAAL